MRKGTVHGGKAGPVTHDGYEIESEGGENVRPKKRNETVNKTDKLEAPGGRPATKQEMVRTERMCTGRTTE